MLCRLLTIRILTPAQLTLFEISETYSWVLIIFLPPDFLVTAEIMLTIVVTDSRGKNLDTWVNNEEVLIASYSGARLIDVAREALNIIPRFWPDTILLMAGINDVTTLNRRTRKVRLISTSRALIIQYLIQQINHAKCMITAAFPHVRVAVGGIIGLELNKYNRRRGVSCWQYVVDDVITAINSYIRQVNSDSGLPHPRLTTKVHTWRRGKRKCIYGRLYDGLHPTDLILASWARQLNLFHRLCGESTVAQLCKN